MNVEESLRGPLNLAEIVFDFYPLLYYQGPFLNHVKALAHFPFLKESLPTPYLDLIQNRVSSVSQFEKGVELFDARQL